MRERKRKKRNLEREKHDRHVVVSSWAGKKKFSWSGEEKLQESKFGFFVHIFQSIFLEFSLVVAWENANLAWISFVTS